MTSRKSTGRRNFSFESLENRALMTGNVTGSVHNHSLTLTGDQQNNQIQILQVGSHDFKVVGLNGTKIDGHSSKTYHGVSADIAVNLGNGNDDVTVGEGANGHATGSKAVELPGALSVDLGNGNNSFSLYGTELPKGVNVNSGSGNDSIVLDDCNIGTLGSADDGDFAMSLGGGNNHVSFHDFSVAGSIRINDTTSGGDNINLRSGSVVGDVLILTGPGADKIQIDAINTIRQLNVSTFGGNYKVILGGLDTHNPANTAAPGGIQADAVFADLGSGNDALQLGGSFSSTKGGGVRTNQFNYDGGAGHDEMLYYQPTGSPIANHQEAPGFSDFEDFYIREFDPIAAALHHPHKK